MSLENPTKICWRCGTGMILMEGEENGSFWLCQKCGIDLPYHPKGKVDDYTPKHDEYWTHEDESEVMSELDEYFYRKYPQFRRHRRR